MAQDSGHPDVRELRLATFTEDLGGVLTSATPGAAELLGAASPEELIGRPASDAMADLTDRARAPDVLIGKLAELRAAVGAASLDLELRDGRWLELQHIPHEAAGISTRLWVFRDVTFEHERRLALEASERLYRKIVEDGPLGVTVVDMDLKYITVNARMCEFVGYDEGELRRGSFADITHPEDVDNDMELAAELFAGRIPFYQIEKRYLHKEGRELWGELTATLIRDEAGSPLYGLGLVEDITERKFAESDRQKLQDELHHAQRLDSIGRLAGGIAHDFNNLLTAILGSADLLSLRLPDNQIALDLAGQIRWAGERAAALTMQLLMFSRKQRTQPVVMDLSSVLGDTDALLRRLLGEDVEFVIELVDESALVLADPRQMEQVIVNLALNARDAMPSGGKLVIASAVTDDAVLLTVEDDGLGMDAATREHIFEPFFTTKQLGKGTGLGLSTVYGIVGGAGGAIDVDSSPGRGTRFTIRFPRQTSERPASTPCPAEVVDPIARGTVLVVEDDPTVRELIEVMLRAAGYNLLLADGGEQALALWQQHEPSVDLLLTDVVMPRMYGSELVARLRERRPELRVLYMSGYTDDALESHGIESGNVGFLPKPFDRRGLLDAVITALTSNEPSTV